MNPADRAGHRGHAELDDEDQRRLEIKPAYTVATLCLALIATLPAQTQPIRYLSWTEAQPVFAALQEPLPAASDWQAWIEADDRRTRARIAEGDETSIVNWLLFGMSFTEEPRITVRVLESNDAGHAVERRVNDLVRALGGTASNERLELARRVLGQGAQARARILFLLDRMRTEQAKYERLTREARELNDARLEFAERSRLYRDRGLSSDTSLRSSYAVEDALKQLAERQRPGMRVARVAVIGPGLDFSDKQEGYDFYPPQTIQPLAVQDSLIRLGLSQPDALRISTFDVSARVNTHLEHAGLRARGGERYVMHLPLNAGAAWTPGFQRYWETVGASIGRPVKASSAAGAGSVKVRTLSVDPAMVENVRPFDLNITAQSLSLPGEELFDLVIGTNVFVYYDRLQQALAMTSVAGMMRPGGILLSNNALLEIPAVGLRSLGYSKTFYSDNSEDGDLMVWYEKAVR